MRPSIRSAVLAAIPLFHSSPVSAQAIRAGADSAVRLPVAARIDSFMTEAAKQGLSGTLLVARRDTILLLAAYGVADRESGARLQVSTPYFIGSIGKHITAVATLRLAADGRLSVRDSVKKFFPEAKGTVRDVTVDQLLSHSSGLPYLPTRGLFSGGSRDSVMREMLGEPIEFPPGSKYGYSSDGFVLLAGIIERASGASYEQNVSRLFEAAGLRNAGFIGDTTRWAATTLRSYSDDRAEGRLGELPLFPRMVGAGSVVMPVPDLYRWYLALRDSRILPPAETRQLFTPRLPIRPGSESAYAWTIVTLPTGTMRLIAGDIGGYNAELRHYVDEQMIVVFASNRRVAGRGDREAVMNTVARMMRD